MDQFAIAMGKKNNAIFLDTATLKYEYAPVDLHDSKLVIVCSNKKRGLGDSKYNERRAECEKALSEIREFLREKVHGIGSVAFRFIRVPGESPVLEGKEKIHVSFCLSPVIEMQQITVAIHVHLIACPLRIQGK